MFHTIDYGSSLDNAGLANYDNFDYLYITRDKYFAYSGETWICDSDSGCSTVGKTFDQNKSYKDSDFCDASNGDCTVTLKVNWKKIDTTINDWRCQGIYSYFITYCDSDDMCEYTRRAYNENGKSYLEYVTGKIDRTTLNVTSCFLDSINDYRCNSNGKYKITTCSDTTCKYTEFNGSSSSGTVDRNSLKKCDETKTMYVTAKSGLNCRAGAGTSYDVVTSFSCGDSVLVNKDSSGGWYYNPEYGCYLIDDYLSDTKKSCGTSCKCTYVRANYKYVNGSSTNNICNTSATFCNGHPRYTGCTYVNGYVYYNSWYWSCS